MRIGHVAGVIRRVFVHAIPAVGETHRHGQPFGACRSSRAGASRSDLRTALTLVEPDALPVGVRGSTTRLAGDDTQVFRERSDLGDVTSPSRVTNSRRLGRYGLV